MISLRNKIINGEILLWATATKLPPPVSLSNLIAEHF